MGCQTFQPLYFRRRPCGPLRARGRL